MGYAHYDNMTLTVDGVTKTYLEWVEPLGIAPHTLAERIRNGWDPKDAISSPAYTKNPRNAYVAAIRGAELLTVDGVTKTYDEWAEPLCISGSGLWRRINVDDWDLTEAVRTRRGERRGGKSHCSRCAWSGRLGTAIICDYLCLTGHRRPVPAKDCDLWTHDGPRPRNVAQVDDDDAIPVMIEEVQG